MGNEPAAEDGFARLRHATPARIGLGRVGAGMPMAAVLAFQAAHAAASDAVHAELDVAHLAQDLGVQPIVAETMAGDRAAYLQYPDLGRRLRTPLPRPTAPCDAAIVLADGLSAIAVKRHGAPLVHALLRRLDGWRLAPLVVVRHGRVAIGDEIGAGLGAAMVLVLIGERPGLSAADSLGAYLTFAPAAGIQDSARNCVSNIRFPGGLAPEAAAARLAWLMTESRRLGMTGTALKDRSPGFDTKAPTRQPLSHLER